jgi:hypothetical protein
MASKTLKYSEYYAFTRWIATPSHLRTPGTQKAFSDQYQVGHDTLARWKKDPLFREDVKRCVDEWTREYTPQIMWSLYTQAMNGNISAIKLWFQYVEGWEAKPLNAFGKLNAPETNMTYKDIILSEQRNSC